MKDKDEEQKKGEGVCSVWFIFSSISDCFKVFWGTFDM